MKSANPFLKGCIDPDEINEIPKDRVKNDEENSALNNSNYQSRVRNQPVVGESKENSASIRHLEYLIDCCNNKLGKSKKKTRIIFWFKKKWNGIFGKKSNNDRFLKCAKITLLY